MKSSHLIFGCGYLGGRVARRWVAQGHQVAAVTRSAEKAAEFGNEGIDPAIADLLDPETLIDLPEAHTVLFAVGFDRQGDNSIQDVYVGGIRNVLAALPDSVWRFIYISTTGVYGETDGGVVDESSPPNPTRPGGKASLAAEQELLAHAANRPDFQPVILRMAGLYGPGRIPLQAKLTAGESLPTSPDGTINLIHIDDASEVVVTAATAEQPSQRYVVSDGHPVKRQDFYSEAAQLLGAPAPQFEPPTDGNSRRSAGSGKRVCNAKLVAELAPRLTYPTYREGLTAIIRDC